MCLSYGGIYMCICHMGICLSYGSVYLMTDCVMFDIFGCHKYQEFEYLQLAVCAPISQLKSLCQVVSESLQAGVTCESC